MTEAAVWSGSWAADRLGVEVDTDSGVGGLVAEDLVGMALRVNPKRAHLLVSRVLGKHVPADPRLVYGTGRLLGALVADRLSGVAGGLADEGGRLIKAALSGADGSEADRLLALCDRHRGDMPTVDALVLGYAETATGLGHSVADALFADYLHSTRRPASAVAPVGAFEETHSHATSHLLLPEDPEFLASPRPLVLVDDELSTGATVMDTIRAVEAVAPRDRYLVAALVDLRSAEDRRLLDEFAADMGLRVDVVALATGRIHLPADALSRGRELVVRYRQPPITRAEAGGSLFEAPTTARWPGDVRDGARHGFTSSDRSAFEDAVRACARGLMPVIPKHSGSRLLVLGMEELMYLPMRIACELAGPLEDRGVQVLFSSTTRSPVVPVDDPGYALRTVLTFGSHDDPADGPGLRYAYNVAPSIGGAPFDVVVLVIDDASRSWPADSVPLPELLADVVPGLVYVLAVPSHRPTAEAMR
ncbi:phosphoribosyltransferase family protein [Blastococcus sp. SYSU DS0753]